MQEQDNTKNKTKMIKYGNKRITNKSLENFAFSRS